MQPKIGLTIADGLMIAAVFLGPIIAVQLTRWLDSRRETRDRKLSIFKTLMATRAYGLSWGHVEALNRISLEFDRANPDERAVIDAWKAYHHLLQDVPVDRWGTQREDLLSDVLHAMARVLGYDFDKTEIKKSAYAPNAHKNLDDQMETIRKSLIAVLQQPLSVSLVESPPVQVRPNSPAA